MALRQKEAKRIYAIASLIIWILVSCIFLCSSTISLSHSTLVWDLSRTVCVRSFFRFRLIVSIHLFAVVAVADAAAIQLCIP